MQSLYFTLVGRQVVPCDGPEEMAAKLARPEWCVGLTPVGDWEVSTCFLGVDWNYGRGRPIVFETIVFDGDEVRGLHARYSTWDAAEAGHARAVTLTRRRLGYTDLTDETEAG